MLVEVSTDRHDISHGRVAKMCEAINDKNTICIEASHWSQIVSVSLASIHPLPKAHNGVWYPIDNETSGSGEFILERFGPDIFSWLRILSGFVTDEIKATIKVSYDYAVASLG